jgi:carboxyl-terminal processing protease
MPRRSLTILIVFMVISFACYRRSERTPYARYLADALEQIDQNYLERVDDQKLFDGAMNGMVSRLDKYSGFVSHAEAARFHQTLDQRFGGIGIEVAQDRQSHELIVTSPVVDTPAYHAGIQAGDRILAIDGKSLDSIPPNKRLEAAVDLLRGQEGAEVTLRYRRPGVDEPFETKLVRAVVKIDSVLGDYRRTDNTWSFTLSHHPSIGYLRVTSFGEQTNSEFHTALGELAEHKLTGLVLDLRDNRGGLLTSARDMCDQFLPAGALIVTTRDRHGEIREEYRASGKGAHVEWPMVVLVNGDSASASEIVAACLQDHERAKVVGERTWGKGTVQHVIPIEGGLSVLRLTTGSYWRPNGHNIHRFEISKDDDTWGVSPDADCQAGMDAKQTLELIEERRLRDVVVSPGLVPNPPRTPKDATEFDPALRKAVELLEPSASLPTPRNSASIKHVPQPMTTANDG